MKKVTFIQRCFSMLLAVGVILVGAGSAEASIDILKMYKKSFPKIAPKCDYCHTDKMPKKADGKHDLNAYGEYLMQMAGEEAISEETIQAAGSHEDFDPEKMAEEAEDMAEEAVEGMTDKGSKMQDKGSKMEKKGSMMEKKGSMTKDKE